MYMNKSIYPLGDSAIVLEFGQEINEEIHQSIRTVCLFLDEYSFEGFIEYVPAFTTVTIFYDPLVSDYQATESLLQEMLDEIGEMEPEESAAVTVEIPVLYGGSDLSFVAAHSGLSEEEVIALHTSAEYLVHMIGFAPGFPYLGGLNEKIATPRKETPRNSVPAGSVGIAGQQTGIYPIETPGGWQIIGQTPLNLFDVEREQPSLLRAGNKVRFVAIDALEFQMLKGEDDGY
jgi:inhibitor of KinA